MNKIFSRSLGLIIVALSFVACAKPTYVSTTLPLGGGEHNNEPESATCDARFQSSGHCVELTWQTKPTDSTVGSFVFSVSRPNEADAQPVLVDTSDVMTVRIFMPSMGHGSSPVTVTQADTGTYRADGIFFSMHGDWQIIFEIKQKNGTVIDKAILPITY
jgi:hypothetical protein